MIKKWQYIDCVNALVDFYKFADKVYEASGGSLDLTESEEVSNVANNLVKLLEYCTNDAYDRKFGSNLSYFLYDTDGGQMKKAFPITDKDGKVIPLDNAEDLWNNFILANHPEVEDKHI